MATLVRYVSDKQELFLYDDNTGISTLESLGWQHDAEWVNPADAPAEPEPETYDGKTVDELREILAERDLPKSGNKDELIARLVEHDTL